MSERQRFNKNDLKLSPGGKIDRICVEAVGDRDQLWVVCQEGDQVQTYYTWLDENYTVAIAQERLLVAALANGLRVSFHYAEQGGARIFAAVTVMA